ncbi:MAG: YidC/Oxa1 family membrane protein insertase, partial [Clostridia bacterium]|nr:YidC/Oxa1 family membrane protein insertase [Clostridia bacterium]
MNIMDIVTVPMGYLLKWLNALFGNQYLLALFAFAVVIEIILSPFGIIQQKNSIKQARLKPKEMAIRKKYAGREDRQTQQLLSQEIQEMYQKEYTSMFAGCLPMLLQFPILIALYNIVMNPLRYICGLSEDAITQIMNIVKTFPEYAEKLKDASVTRTIGLMSQMESIMEEYGSEVFAGVEGFST